MESSPHHCDTCDANCNFNLPNVSYDDKGLPSGARLSLRQIRACLDELECLLLEHYSSSTESRLSSRSSLITSRGTELRHLLSKFLFEVLHDEEVDD